MDLISTEFCAVRAVHKIYIRLVITEKENCVVLWYRLMLLTGSVCFIFTIFASVRPGAHYPNVTWAHVILRVRLGCERQFNIEFYGADSHFCHSAYVTWSHVELWSAHVPARLACWHVSRPELYVRSRNVSRVTEMWICAIEFNVKSPLKHSKRTRNITWAHVTRGWCVPDLTEFSPSCASILHSLESQRIFLNLILQ
jgi:hypothetical protein